MVTLFTRRREVVFVGAFMRFGVGDSFADNTSQISNGIREILTNLEFYRSRIISLKKELPLYWNSLYENLKKEIKELS